MVHAGEPLLPEIAPEAEIGDGRQQRDAEHRHHGEGVDENGLVERQRDHADERSLLVSLTARGRELRQQAAGVPTEIIARLGEDHLRTGRPKPAQVRDAVWKVRNDRRFKERAIEISEELAHLGGAPRAAELVDALLLTAPRAESSLLARENPPPVEPRPPDEQPPDEQDVIVARTLRVLQDAFSPASDRSA